jgi:hypothetical protein
MNNYTCSRVMAVYIYCYQYNLYMFDLFMFIHHIVSITQVLKVKIFNLGKIIGVGVEIIKKIQKINKTKKIYVHTTAK